MLRKLPRRRLRPHGRADCPGRLCRLREAERLHVSVAYNCDNGLAVTIDAGTSPRPLRRHDEGGRNHCGLFRAKLALFLTFCKKTFGGQAHPLFQLPTTTFAHMSTNTALTVPDSIFSRSSLILGDDAMQMLAKARVAVFGIGGVGSWAAEALVRTGLRHITLVDAPTAWHHPTSTVRHRLQFPLLARTSRPRPCTNTSSRHPIRSQSRLYTNSVLCSLTVYMVSSV